MGLIAKILSFTRAMRKEGSNVSIVKVDPGGGANLSPIHGSVPGIDAHPLPSDYALLVTTQRSGVHATAAYFDPLTQQQALAGEIRSHGRDNNALMVNQVWLKNDGEVLIENSNGNVTLAPDGTTTINNASATFTVSPSGSILGTNGSGQFELQSNGDFVVNGVTITTAGDIQNATVPSYNVHNHNIVSGSSAPGPTGPPQ